VTREISRDTALCISLSARPSNVGTRFHNYLYEALDLDFIYKAFASTDLAASVAGIRGLGIRGAGISMPFKEAVIPLLDSLDESATAIQSVNTILNTDGHLRGLNTDFIAVRNLLNEIELERALPIVVYGSGGMAKAVVAAIRDLGFAQCTIVARNTATGQALATQYGFEYSATPIGGSVLINATPVGMTGGEVAPSLSIPLEFVAKAQVVLDVIAFPSQTPLMQIAAELAIATIPGSAVMTLQAVEQFVLYTGVRPSPELITAAAIHSRG